jgi:hypothetical protein
MAFDRVQDTAGAVAPLWLLAFWPLRPQWYGADRQLSRNSGSYVATRDLQGRVLAAREQTLDPKHPDTVRSKRPSALKTPSPWTSALALPAGQEARGA